MLKLLISLLGIVAGYAVAHIASEELADGRKYFVLIERTLFVIIFVVVIYYQFAEFITLAIFSFLAIIFFMVSMKRHMWRIANAGLFVMPYLLYQEQQFRIVLASLLFLYGLPLGTLLYENQKRS